MRVPERKKIFLSLELRMLAISQFISQKTVQNSTDDRGYQRAQESAPEPGLCQREPYMPHTADPTGESEHESVDDQREQAQGEDDQQAR